MFLVGMEPFWKMGNEGEACAQIFGVFSWSGALLENGKRR
jgi:hypothetical protein